jgi:transposase InsO family protein
VHKYLNECVDCQLGKTATTAKAGLLEPIEVTEPFQKVCMDFLGPLPTTERGNKYLLVLIDLLTKWPEIYPLPDRKATTVARVIALEFIPRHGAIQELLSDNGAEFHSELVQEITHMFNIHKVFSSAYHPQTQGSAENMNKNILHMLKMYVNADQTDWDIYINFLLFAYRSAVHESTFYSPFALVYGRDPILPSEINYGLYAPRVKSVTEFKQQLDKRLAAAYDMVRQNIERAHEHQKQSYDAHRRHLDYSIGSYVWLYVPVVKEGRKLKLAKLWHGPYVIIGKRSDNTYLLQTLQVNGKRQFVHVERLKPFIDPDHVPHEQLKLKHPIHNIRELDEYLSIDYSDDGILHTKAEWGDYPVESIVDERTIDDRHEYLIKWERWPSEYNSWVPASDCNCKQKIREFNRRKSRSP